MRRGVVGRSVPSRRITANQATTWLPLTGCAARDWAAVLASLRRIIPHPIPIPTPMPLLPRLVLPFILCFHSLRKQSFVFVEFEPNGLFVDPAPAPSNLVFPLLLLLLLLIPPKQNLSHHVPTTSSSTFPLSHFTGPFTYRTILPIPVYSHKPPSDG
jgi:hypothetical protein